MNRNLIKWWILDLREQKIHWKNFIVPLKKQKQFSHSHGFIVNIALIKRDWLPVFSFKNILHQILHIFSDEYCSRAERRKKWKICIKTALRRSMGFAAEDVKNLDFLEYESGIESDKTCKSSRNEDTLNNYECLLCIYQEFWRRKEFRWEIFKTFVLGGLLRDYWEQKKNDASFVSFQVTTCNFIFKLNESSGESLKRWKTQLEFLRSWIIIRAATLDAFVFMFLKMNLQAKKFQCQKFNLFLGWPSVFTVSIIETRQKFHPNFLKSFQLERFASFNGNDFKFKKLKSRFHIFSLFNDWQNFWSQHVLCITYQCGFKMIQIKN